MIKSPYTLILDYLKTDYFRNNPVHKLNSQLHAYYNSKLEEENFKFGENAMKLEYQDKIISNASDKSTYGNRLALFPYESGCSYIVYSTKLCSLCLYNLTTSKLLIEVPNAHNDTVIMVKHYYDSKRKVNLVLTASYDYSVKLWEINSSKGELTVENIITVNNSGIDHGIRAGLVISQGKYFFVSCSIYNVVNKFDCKGQLLLSVTLPNYLFALETWTDPKSGIAYIIVGNDSTVTSLKFENLENYHTYSDGNFSNHYGISVTNQGVLIESDRSGDLRLWDFHSGKLLKKIQSKLELNGLCIWNDNFIFSGAADGKIALFNTNLLENNIDNNTENDLSVKIFKDQDSSFIRAVEKIIDPVYGACLISYSNSGSIHLWTCS